MSDIIIFGTGSFGEVAHIYFSLDSPHRPVAFTATADYITGNEFDALPLVPFETIEHEYPPERYEMFVAAGARNMNETRARLFDLAKAKGYRLVTYLSSKCTHWGDTKIGENSFIFESNTIQPKVTIGSNVVLWSGNHIGHHSTIGDHTFVTSHVVISGHVRIGAKCFVGVNATIRDDIAIANSCFIGPGTLILKPTKEGEVYIAEPTRAHPLKSSDMGF